MYEFGFTYINSWAQNTAVARTAVIINGLTFVMLLGIILLAILVSKRKFFSVVLLILSGISAWFVATGLKVLFHTARPFNALGFIPLVPESGYSFPSGHATVFAALAFSMFFINRPAGIALFFLAILVGLSRVVLGVHFPVDIIGGYLVGAVVSTLYVRLFEKI
jgi:undecaprenyl-diphosphatase